MIIFPGTLRLYLKQVCTDLAKMKPAVGSMYCFYLMFVAGASEYNRSKSCLMSDPAGVSQNVVLWLCAEWRTGQLLLHVPKQTAPSEVQRHQEAVWEHRSPPTTHQHLQRWSTGGGGDAGEWRRGSGDRGRQWGQSEVKSFFVFSFIFHEVSGDTQTVNQTDSGPFHLLIRLVTKCLLKQCPQSLHGLWPLLCGLVSLLFSLKLNIMFLQSVILFCERLNLYCRWGDPPAGNGVKE